MANLLTYDQVKQNFGLLIIKENDWINKKINCLNTIKNFILGENI